MRFEAVFLYLYDVGRSVDLPALAQAKDRPATGAPGPARRLDTPESLLLPTPLVFDLGTRDAGPGDDPALRRAKYRAKVYADGVVTIEARVTADLPLDRLHTLRSLPLPTDRGPVTVGQAAAAHFEAVSAWVGPHVDQDQYRFDDQPREDYHVYVLLDPVDDPTAFLEAHGGYLAPFLLGEDPSVRLHAQQIEMTMRNPFSFTAGDVAVFDNDRAFLIAPQGDFEDLILIIEHANYQLMELRALDLLLDRMLDDTEKGLRHRRAPARLKYLQPLRLDALFLLENLENSSRIVGDYYLGQIYDHLGTLFQLKGWKQNVERRLDILQSVYTMAKTDRSEGITVFLELLVVVLIAIEVVALGLPLVHP